MERPVAVDAMGGDFAPAETVAGAVLASRELRVPIRLVGREPDIRSELRHHRTAGLPIEIVPASEIVAMDESPVTAFRRKKDSSLHVAASLARDGTVQAIVSAGNTGAVMTTMKMLCGVLEGVERPALCAVVPNLHGPSVWLDVGANVDCKPVHLVQFAIMGHLYAREVLGLANPRVGLMSIGEEDGKGNDVTRETFRSLKEMSLNFIGNVEGRDIFSGKADVIVCDGFTGNIALKVSEGLVEVLADFLSEEFRRRVDYSEYGGAPLLGVAGVAVVGHGRSSAKAVRNGIALAHRFASERFVARVEQDIAAAAITHS
jgi:glycerol-3-phosphate acyltransferase PlsX